VSETRARQSRSDEPYLQLVVLGVAVVAAAAVLAALLLTRSGGTRTAIPQATSATIVTRTQLEHFAQAAGQPIYWAGPRSGDSYELTRTPSGRTYVRYLPKGVAAGDSRAAFLTIGTYPGASSYSDLKHAAKAQGTLSVGLDGGGIMLFSTKSPTSVYFGYPGKRYQVEVFAPSADAARKLVLAGRVTAIR
jgi:hypothetical protein